MDPKIIRSDQVLAGLSMGPGKPEHAFAQTGRLHVFAGGNADVEMLESAPFAVLVNHDDEDRGYAYTVAAEKAPTKAKELGRTVISMKDDWSTIFWISEVSESAPGPDEGVGDRSIRLVPGGGEVDDAVGDDHVHRLVRQGDVLDRPERELDVLDACPGLAPPGELGHLGRHAEAGPARYRPAAPGQSTAAAYPFMAPLPAPTHMKTTRSPSLTRPARRSSSSMIRVLAAEVLP